MIFSGASEEEALERASQALGLPVESLEAEVLEDSRRDEEGESDPEAGVCIRVCVRLSYVGDRAREILVGLLAAMGMEGSVDQDLDGGTILLNVSAPGGSILIGREGHTLDAIQHWLTRAMARVALATPSLLVDVEDYRQRKFARLRQTARGAAHDAARTGEPARLPIMGSIERKFVHNCLKDFEGVTTYSVGHEGRCYVVVAPEEEATGGVVIDQPDLPDDDLISDPSAFSQLRVIATPSGDDAEEDEEASSEVLEGAKDESSSEDDEEAIEDELH